MRRPAGSGQQPAGLGWFEGGTGSLGTPGIQGAGEPARGVARPSPEMGPATGSPQPQPVLRHPGATAVHGSLVAPNHKPACCSRDYPGGRH